MSNKHDEDDMTEKTHQEKSAFVRDGALVLYFDMAEKPVLARFDLDTLAQASFEVSAKDKDGFYTIMLHDFSSDPQPVAQFASKGDAHQALYAILQALLTQKEQTVMSSHAGMCRTSGVCCRFFKGLFKAAAYVLILAVLAYAALFVYYTYVNPSRTQVSAPAPQSADGEQTSAAPSAAIPEGEALSAEDYLSTLLGDQSAPASP